jgi:hypothetical protein
MTALLTSNGLLVALPKNKWAFFSNAGEFRREATQQEVTHLQSILPVCILPAEDWNAELPTWNFITSVQTSADYSLFKAETSSNGGDYSFFTYEDWFLGKVNGEWVLRSITRHSTSAEFDYDELSGTFQICNGKTDVVNWDDRLSGYFTQNQDFVALEQISQIRQFSDLLTSKNEVIPENSVKYTASRIEMLCQPISLTKKREIVSRILEITGSTSVKQLRRKPRTRKIASRR